MHKETVTKAATKASGSQTGTVRLPDHSLFPCSGLPWREGSRMGAVAQHTWKDLRPAPVGICGVNVHALATNYS